jgi:hypothetical protein
MALSVLLVDAVFGDVERSVVLDGGDVGDVAEGRDEFRPDGDCFHAHLPSVL